MIYILIKDPNSLLNRLFAAFLLCFAVWSLSDTFVHNPALSKHTIVLSNKFGALGWIGFSAFFLWFCLVFTEKKKILKIKLFYIIIFGLPLLLIYRHWTGFLVKDYNKEYFGWAIVWAETAWTYLFYLYFVSFMGIGLYVVFDFMKKTEDMVRKKQAQIIFGAAILPLIVGMSTEIILPKINIFLYPGIGSSVTLIWVLGVFYSMIRYKFLTITPSNAAENIVSTMAESLILLDAVGIIVDINKATEDLLGYQKNELKGKSFDFLLPEHLQKTLLDRIIKGENIKSYDIVFKTKNLENILVSFSTSLLKDSAGDIAGIIGVAADITERKKVEEVLRESEERYRTLVENAPVAVYRTIPGPKEKFLMGNPTYLKIFGLESEEELKKISAADVYMNPEERKAFSDNLLAKGSVSGVELRLRKKDGTPFWGSVTAKVVYDENGKNPYFDSTIMDITERKKMEEQRDALIKKLEENQKLLKKQNQELEDSRRAIKNVAEDLGKSKQVLEERKEDLEKINKELDDFTYIISHDLKEPLRSIDAFSKFIGDDYNDKLDEEGRNYLERIRANASRMQSLIEDLLEISRIERKKNALEEVETEELVNEAKLRLEYAIKNKNAEIVVRDKLPRVFCDRVRLTGVFVNLISNAIKFNDKPNPCIEINCSPKGIFYEFYVKDNGPGIEERYFDKIFEIFQRLGKRGDQEGTGAGLTIVKKIVEMHKGRIWVESKIGKGATFYFTIPKKKEIILGKKKIGEILIEKKPVAEEEVKKALEEQEKMG
jgi:PAS domain S-box-containing protein